MTITVPRTVSNPSSPTFGSTPTLSFATLPSAGSNVVLVAVCWGLFVSAGSLADNQGNTYTKQLTATGPNASGPRIEVWLAENIGTPSGTFTLTYTTNGTGNIYGAIGAVEVVGALTASSFGVSATNSGTNTSTFDATSGTTASSPAAGDLAIAAFGIDGGSNPGNGNTPSGYTNVVNNPDGTAVLPSRVDYQVLSSGGAQTATWTSVTTPSALGGTGDWVAAIVTIKAASGGGDTLMGQACL